MPEERYDVTIIGAGPAGATAATLLGRRGRTVALVDRSNFPRPSLCAGWVSAKLEPLLGEIGLPSAGVLHRTFRSVTFYNPDFTKTAKPRFEGVVGYLVDRAAFDHALVQTATQHGVTLLAGHAAVDIRLNESSVVVTRANNEKVTSRLLLLASGRSPELLSRIGVARQPVGNSLWTVQVETRIEKQADSVEPQVGVVLGLDGAGSFGFLCVTHDRAVINVNWAGENDRVRAVLVALCKTAFQHQVVPADMSPLVAAAPLVRSPAAVALDMDSHVAKHTLLIGDAGGFVSAAGNEGIFPAMWSAKLAAKAIESALQSEVSQDQLMSFDSLWRTQMADYLRSPHTDIRFLLPLIFQNQPMADRMGQAFFFGENL